MKAIYNGVEEAPDFFNELIPIFSTISQKVELLEIAGQLKVRLYDSNTLIKTVNVKFPTTGRTVIDLSVFSALLPVVDCRNQFAAQRIEISDVSSTFTIQVLNQCATGYESFTTTTEKTINDSADAEFFGGRVGEVLSISQELLGKENFVTNSLAINVVQDGSTLVKVHPDLKPNFLDAFKSMPITLSMYCDISVTKKDDNYNYAFILKLNCKSGEKWILAKGNETICGRISFEDVVPADAQSIAFCIIEIRPGCKGVITKPKIELYGLSEFVPSFAELHLPATYTIGSGVGYPIRYAGDVTINGKETVSYKRDEGLLVRWQNRVGGTDQHSFASFKFQEQFDKMFDANKVDETLIQLDKETTADNTSYFNFLCKSSIIEVFNVVSQKWIKAKCTNKNGAIFNNASKSGIFTVTLSVSEWN